ncbi:alpha/beta hydrolase [Mycobacterium sp. CBMA 234]|uniref:alpha/beta hydrolase n=1 Tax=Mycolicibacterium sp. CBMA 234 TaxID=1918495 RepID=UPI0012DDDFE4|nr:alpha/beta hydrolase [Mycolicibacterium sp. CBMA 234]MUL67790.1 alpha/beta hydrolase [Mycolicibacterium sp. CBMA 234]
MALPVDPEIRAALGNPTTAEPGPPVGDVETRRRNLTAGMAAAATAWKPAAGVDRTDLTIPTPDGYAIPAQWYRPGDAEKLTGAVLFLHGGAMILPLLPIYDAVARMYVQATGVSVLLIDYRVAPEHPDPTPVEDCYTALRWLSDHAGELGVDPNRIAVMGDSAGGGLSAGVALMARDRNGPAIVELLLIYPMLDDRTYHPDPQLPAEYITFGYDDNRTGWGALLGVELAGERVSSYAAPARATDLSGLPRTYIEVGNLDILRDEDIAYASRLLSSGVPTELHVIPGLPHGYDILAPDALATRRAVENRLRRLRSL